MTMTARATTSTVGRQRGFTLIELMVAITLFAILLAIAVPAFTQWVRNAQLRGIAETLQNGLRQAKATARAVERVVVFSTTNAQPAFGAPAAVNGLNWSVQTIPLLGGTDANHPQFVKGGRFASETSGSGITVTVTGGPAALCINPQGRLVANPAPGVGAGVECAVPAGQYVRYAIVRTPSVAGKDRRYGVEITQFGEVRMCDLDRDLSATVPDGCTPP
jgi:type IV fimbrial biogenesis protein FimT